MSNNMTYWGKRYGHTTTDTPKGSTVPWGNCIEVPRGSSLSRAGGSHNAPTGYKMRWYLARAKK